jgi:hypothetical protein
VSLLKCRQPLVQLSLLNCVRIISTCYLLTLVLRSRIFYPAGGGDTILRNVGSIDHIYTAPHPRRRHSSYAKLIKQRQKWHTWQCKWKCSLSLLLALDGGRVDGFSPLKRARGAHWVRNWVVSRTGLDTVTNRIVSPAPSGNRTEGFWSVA